MPEVVILIGNIGCGKSTLTKVLSGRYVILSRDSFRYGIGAGRYIFNPVYEPAIVKTAVFMFKEFLELGCDIVVDEVNVSKQYRQKYISEAKAKGYTVTAIVLPRLPKEEAVNRRMSNPHDSNTREHWEDVWDKFEAKYEMPTEEEGFDKVIDFSVK